MVGRGLDVDLAAGEAGGQTGVLPLLADGQTQLIVRHDGAAGFAVLGHGHADDVRRCQSGGHELRPILAEGHDVDLLTVQLLHNGVHALAAGAYAGADGIHVFIGGINSHLRAAAGLAGDGADLHRAVENFRHFQLKQALDQPRVRAGNEHLRAAAAAAHFHQIHLQHLPLVVFLAHHLLAQREHSVGGVGAGAQTHGGVAGALVNAQHGAGEDLVLLGVKLVIDHAVLGLPQPLNDDLLAVAGGDAAEVHVLHGEAHGVAHMVLGGDGLGLLGGDFGGGVLHLLHHGLLHKHLQVVLFLVHVHHHVFHVLVVALIGGGESLHDLFQHKILGDAPLLLQQLQSGKDFFTFHSSNSCSILEKSKIRN